MAQLFKGAQVAAALNDKTARRVALLKERGIEPTLAILRVGAREDDVSYERSAIKRCGALGVAVKSVALPQDVSQAALEDALLALNADTGVHGILLFRPLPRHLDEEAVCRLLAPEKDVDGITDSSLAGVFTGSGTGFSPCTAQACMETLTHYGVDPCGKRAVVIGRSLVVGRPVAMLLMRQNATVTICHTKTKDIPALARQADILIAATGRANNIGADYAAPGQVVIDVGINWDEAQGRLCGDVDFAAVEPVVEAITPVPGGIGTVTTALLVSHVAEAALRQLGLPLEEAAL